MECNIGTDIALNTNDILCFNLISEGKMEPIIFDVL